MVFGLCLIQSVFAGETGISFHFQNTSLDRALQQLINTFELPVVYQNSPVDTLKVTASCDNCPLDSALARLLADVSLQWKKVGDQYILTTDKTKLQRLKADRLITVRGFVRDASNGETIPYANVVIAGTRLGCAADEHGYYVISDIPSGKRTLRTMMVGFKPLEIALQLGSEPVVTQEIFLEEQAIEMQAVLKTAERERFERQIESSNIQMTQQQIESAPAFVEADLFRSLQTLPGVMFQSDFSSALYIRGGNPSENLIMLDDIRIYNPYHFGGVFSTFNTDAIKSVDVSLGGFPVRYGNSISSIISVTNKDGNNQHFHSKGNISLLSSKLMLEGPISRGSYLVSIRRTYFDVIYNELIRKTTSDPDQKMPYYFYDFHGKVNYRISNNTQLTLSGFCGDDILSSKEDQIKENFSGQTYVAGKERYEIKFGNYCTTAKLQTVFNPKLFSEFILASSRFRVKLYGDYEGNGTDAHDLITDYTLKGDLTWFLKNSHELKTGFELQQLQFQIDMRINNWQVFDYRRKSCFYSGYIQDDWEVTPLLNIQSGLRFTCYTLDNYFRTDPRINGRYKLSENLNLKAGVGVYHQYFYTFNPEDVDFFNYVRLIDLWFPIDSRYQPIRATHFIGGMEYLWKSRFTFSVEGYYKDYDHLLDLNELGDKAKNDDFLSGYGESYGVEFLMRKERGELNGWLSYTLSFAERCIEKPNASYNQDEIYVKKSYTTYPPSYDRRHAFTAVVRYGGFEKWDLSTRFTYCSGLPETPIIGWKNDYAPEGGTISISSDKFPVYAERNSRRLPPYFRLDVSASRTYRFTKWTLTPYLQISNVTNHHNILMYDYDLDAEYDASGQLQPAKRQGISMLPILPTLGVEFEF